MTASIFRIDIDEGIGWIREIAGRVLDYLFFHSFIHSFIHFSKSRSEIGH